MVTELRLDFEVLTPLFLGGAGQEAELRPPALKGLLRFWYRAVDPRFSESWQDTTMTREARFFGSTAYGAGQSPFLLRIQSPLPKPLSWDDFRTVHQEGTEKKARDGLVYLGFPFQLPGNRHRNAIPPGHTFTVRCIVPRGGKDTDLRRVLVAAWWLLGHLGGSGSRARRGFGSLVLQSWTVENDLWPELADLPLLTSAASPDEWLAGLDRARNTFQTWLGDFAAADTDNRHHPHLGKAFRYLLLTKPFPRQQWAMAMAHMGSLMQEFRMRRAPDYQEVKNQVLAQSQQEGRPLQYTPDRASFGLPLTFRYSSGGNITVVPYDQERKTTFERQGSLLQLRLVVIREQLYPLFLRLDGDVPGETPPGAIRGQARPLRAFRKNAMDLFLDSLKEK
jgi:CRISPR-associated protein Cmr1